MSGGPEAPVETLCAISPQERKTAEHPRERARALAAAGQLELRFPIRVADCERLVQTGDLS
jgi:hypothetical protein